MEVCLWIFGDSMEIVSGCFFLDFMAPKEQMQVMETCFSLNICTVRKSPKSRASNSFGHVFAECVERWFTFCFMNFATYLNVYK